MAGGGGVNKGWHIGKTNNNTILMSSLRCKQFNIYDPVNIYPLRYQHAWPLDQTYDLGCTKIMYI